MNFYFVFFEFIEVAIILLPLQGDNYLIHCNPRRWLIKLASHSSHWAGSFSPLLIAFNFILWYSQP